MYFGGAKSDHFNKKPPRQKADRIACVLLGLVFGTLFYLLLSFSFDYFTAYFSTVARDLWFLLLPLGAVILLGWVAWIIAVSQIYGTSLGHLVRGIVFPFVIALLVHTIYVPILLMRELG